MKHLRFKLTGEYCVYVALLLLFSLEIITEYDSGTADLNLSYKLECDPRWELKKRGVSKYIKRTSTDVKGLCEEYLDEQWTGRKNIYDNGLTLFKGSLYYCKIPKCASSFLGFFFKDIYKTENITEDTKFTIKKRRYIPHAYSFMFVRNPYERLFSAYENKLFHPGEWWPQIGTEIIREVRHNFTALNERLGHDVTFQELIRYVLKLHEQGREMNRHVAPMHTFCNPCRQKFDFIGRLETMTEDLIHLVNEWKSKDFLSEEIESAVDIESRTKYEWSFGRINHMFWAVKNYKYTVSVYKLFQRNWASYQTSGMILKKYEMPFNELNVNETTPFMYRNAVESAINASAKYRTQLMQQRKEALVQAYRTVPVNDMKTLKTFVRTDCILFGYDDKPTLLFERDVSTRISDYDYFKWL